MAKSILITGISGSGKSSISKKLNELGYKSYGIEEIKSLFSLRDKKTGREIKNHNNNLQSVKQHSWICDKNKLQKIITKNKDKTTYYCGMASNLNEIISLFDKIFLLKINKKNLNERLNNRTTSGFGHALNVRKWIFNGEKSLEIAMSKKGAIIIDANNSLNIIVKNIIKNS